MTNPITSAEIYGFTESIAAPVSDSDIGAAISFKKS